MRYNLFIISAFILVLMASTISASSGSDTIILRTGAESVIPNPVEPGSEFTLNFRIYNNGLKSAENVSVELAENSFFSLTGKDTEFDNSFSLCAACSKDSTFHFTVKQDVLSGEYPVIFKISDGKSTMDKTVLVKVTGKPDIIFSAKIGSDEISPGKDMNVHITVRNVGTGIAKSIKIKPDTNGIVMDGENLIFIDEIAPGKEISKDVTFMLEDNIAPGPERLDFGLSYQNEKGTAFTATQSLGFMIKNIVVLDISSLKLEPTQFTPAIEGTLTLRIENLGEGTAKDVRVILDTEDFSGNKEAFLGKIEEDEDAPAIFHLISMSPGSKRVPIRITYTDDDGKKTISENISVEVRSVNNKILVPILIVLAIVIAALVIFVTARKKKKDE